MREWPYAKEPFDLKLFILLFLKRLWIVVCATVIGTVLIGGGYYLNKVVFGGPDEYEITSSYYVEYNSVNAETGEVYFHTNSATWGSLVVTDWFVDRAWEHALEAGMVPEKYDIEKADLKTFFSATLPTDVRIPTSTVVTPYEELTKFLNTGLQQAFVDLGVERSEMDEIRVIDSTPLAIADKNIRVGNACILGAVIGFFMASFGLALAIICSDAIIIPDNFTYRYGLPMAGFAGKKGETLDQETMENMEYLFGNKKDRIALRIGESQKAEEVLALLSPAGFKESLPTDSLGKADYEKLRLTDGVLLLVEADAHNAKEIEHVLHELQLQDIVVTGALLYHADTKLIKAYRWGRGRK